MLESATRNQSLSNASFFLPDDGVCPAYRNIRDSATGPAAEGRAFVEALWRRYQGLEDPHFLRDARRHFQERFWEMYLAVTFIDRELSPMRRGTSGPEFTCDYQGQQFWVEAVAPKAGDGDDRVEEPRVGVVTSLPTEKILLRFTGAVAEKRRRYLAAVDSGRVDPSAPYVLAINSNQIPYGPLGNALPFYLQALLPIGAPTLVIDRNTGKTVDSYYALRETIQKANAATVSTANLLHQDYAFISAVVHSGVDCVNRPDVLGRDFTVLHNPNAARPIGLKAFGWCKQYLFEDWELRAY
jgi:hypothetical protein